MTQTKKMYPTKTPKAVEEISIIAAKLYAFIYGTKTPPRSTQNIWIAHRSIRSLSKDMVAAPRVRDALASVDRGLVTDMLCDAMRFAGFVEILHDGLPYTVYPPEVDLEDASARVNARFNDDLQDLKRRQAAQAEAQSATLD